MALADDTVVVSFGLFNHVLDSSWVPARILRERLSKITSWRHGIVPLNHIIALRVLAVRGVVHDLVLVSPLDPGTAAAVHGGDEQTETAEGCETGDDGS